MIEIDAKGLQQLSRTLQALPEESAKASMRAINYAAKRARTLGGRKIREQVNLKAPYVNEQLKVSRFATLQKPEAVISARHRPVRLARYNARQLTRRGPYAKGDPLRKISAGRVQAGVSVKVKKGGQTRRMRKAFLVPLRRGKMPGDSSHMGIFIRTGKDRKAIRHLYGPSVNQVFRSVRDDINPSIRQDLAAEYGRQLDLAFNRRRR